jgi:hypothetical protein
MVHGEHSASFERLVRWRSPIPWALRRILYSPWLLQMQL